MKRQTYYFTVGKEQHKVIAESAGHAMQWMNRQVMDQLNMGPFAWMVLNPTLTTLLRATIGTNKINNLQHLYFG
jgi:hypothetical protein